MRTKHGMRGSAVAVVVLVSMFAVSAHPACDYWFTSVVKFTNQDHFRRTGKTTHISYLANQTTISCRKILQVPEFRLSRRHRWRPANSVYC